MNLEVWQRKELRANFPEVWQEKELGAKSGYELTLGAKCSLRERGSGQAV
jgi:hypothetical protein